MIPQFYNYFKGVALILRSLLDKAEKEDIGVAFLDDLRRIHNELAPSLILNSSPARAPETPEKATKRGANEDDNEVTFLSARTKAPRTPTTSSDNGVAGSPFKRLRISSPNPPSPNNVPPHIIQTSIWEALETAAIHRPLSNQLLPPPSHVRPAVHALRTVLGPLGVVQLQKLQKEVTYPTALREKQKIPWQSLLSPDVKGNVHTLFQCCKAYASTRHQIGGPLSLDIYGLNVARYHLRNGWNGEPDQALALGPVVWSQVYWELCEGEKLRKLVDMFGPGILVLVGSEARIQLGELDPEVLGHVVASIPGLNAGLFLASVKDACRHAEQMMITAATGKGREFHPAVKRAIEGLEELPK